ncbi:hypothetical protein T5B8_11287 [Salinisphaera sp. T5B8]|uniref:hypothetical protein n=1 Tax=Salinisphaera sp. T5B8 TaxID=1304154 RepID=UPI0033422C00
MATRDLALIGVRLIAFYLVVRGLLVAAQSVPYLWASQSVDDPSLVQLSVLLQLVVPVVLAALMWLGAPWLADRMTRASAGAIEPGGLSAEAVAATAFGVAGVVVLIHGLPQLTWSAVQALVVSRQTGTAFTAHDPWWQVAALALRCVLAIAVVCGARSLGRWVLRLRTLGLHSGAS